MSHSVSSWTTQLGAEQVGDWFIGSDSNGTANVGGNDGTYFEDLS
ncbi:MULTISPECIES: hypothetical protein [Prochlorococcus]|nr:hypothetical protein [Prochlorococcus marinus]